MTWTIGRVLPEYMKAVLFDLYETLVTGYNPDRRRKQRGARLGLAEDYFDREWRSRHDQRMRGEFHDYHSVIRGHLRVG